MKRRNIIVAMSIAACACTTEINVRPVDAQAHKITEVCIRLNPKVVVPEFTDILQEGFARHGIRTNVYSNIPPECEYSLNYTATQKWDVTTFMADAQLILFCGPLLVGSATRNAPTGIFGGGGINPAKWGSTRSKLDPLIDELLSGYSKGH